MVYGFDIETFIRKIFNVSFGSNMQIFLKREILLFIFSGRGQVMVEIRIGLAIKSRVLSAEPTHEKSKPSKFIIV